MNQKLLNNYFTDELLDEKGYKRSSSQPSMYYDSSLHESVTMEKCEDPISQCLLDQMNNDPQLCNNEGRKNEIFEELKNLEPRHYTKLSRFWEQAPNILQRTINILELKEGKIVHSSAKNRI